MTKEFPTIMLGEGPRNGGREFCPIFSEACSHVLKIYGQADRTNPSFLDFRLELAAHLIGSFCGRSRVGRPHSQSPVDLEVACDMRVKFAVLVVM